MPKTKKLRPKGTILTWIIFVIVILGGFAALVYFQQKKEATVSAPKTPVIQEGQEETVKPTPKGFATPEITDENEQKSADATALDAALRNGTGCESIKYDAELQQKCSDTLAFSRAIERLDESACDPIKDADIKTECLDQIRYSNATRSKDKELCNTISNAKLKQTCLDQLLAARGHLAASAAECSQISDTVLKQSCLNSFYMSSSIKNLEIESCRSISDSELEDRCTKSVQKNIQVMEIAKKEEVRQLKTAENKLTDCEKLGPDSAKTCKDEANYNLALEKKDLSYCNQINDPDRQSSCITVNTANINQYYLRLATSKKDVSLCARILDAGLRTTCQTYAQ